MAEDEDDKLLKALGRVAAEDAQEDPKWEAVVAEQPLDDAARGRIAESLASKMAPRRRAERAWGRIGVVAGGLALAAGLAFLVTRPSASALPDYTIDPTGPASMRAPSAPNGNTCTLQPAAEGSFELVVRPSRELRGDVRAQVFAFDGRDHRSIGAEVEVAPSGSIRITGKRSSLIGARSVGVLVARPSALAANGAFKALTGETSSEWQMLACGVSPAE